MGWPKVLLLVAAIYLIVGLTVAKATDSGQIWVCPDPTAPHGETVGNFKRSGDCRPTATRRIQHYVGSTLLWPVLLAYSGDDAAP